MSSAAVAVGVGEEPGVPVDPPAAGRVAEVRHDQLHGTVGSVRLRAGHPDAAVTETDDVGPAVAVGVGHQPRVPVDPPPTGVVAEVRDHQLGCGDPAVVLRPGNPHAGVAEADDVVLVVAGGVGEEPGMPLHPPAARVVAEVADDELRRPAEMSRGVLAEGEVVRLHEAGDTAARRAVRTVPVGHAEPAPRAAAVATAVGVLVRATEDVARLVGEDAVDVVRSPAVVVVVHDEPRPADARVREVRERVLRDEPAVGPASPEPDPEFLDVGLHAGPVRAEPDGPHRRVAPARLQVGHRVVGGHGERDVLDVVGEADSGERVGRRQPPEPVLDLRDHLGDLGVGELQRRRRPLHDDDAHRDRSFEVRARGRGRGRAELDARGRRSRGHRDTPGHVPVLAGSRPVLLGGAVLPRLPQPKRGESQPLDLGQLRLRRVELRHAGRARGRVPRRDRRDAHSSVPVN